MYISANLELGVVQTCANIIDFENMNILQNEYLFGKVGFDTAENEPLQVRCKIRARER